MKHTGRIVLAIFGPLGVIALFVAPVFFLHVGNFFRYAFYVGEIIGALLLIFWYRKTAGISFSEFGLKMTYSWSSAIWSVLYLIIRIAAWVVIVPQAKITTNIVWLLAQAAFFLCLNALGEELHFRGLLLATLSQAFQHMKPLRNLILTALITSGVFAIFHILDILSSGWVWVPMFIAEGLALFAVRIKTQSIVWSLLVHGILNTCTGALFIGAQQVDDPIAYAYIVAVIVIDVVFFTFIISQSKRQMQDGEMPASHGPAEQKEAFV